ncbi:MAG: protein-glutamate O-methyltransferase CheR [Planctomycetes bacterium]|nr:protein-glutamate O-methyltransferase CheR [Planctomycetota bacterium]
MTDLVKSLCGVELGVTKGYLIESRLAPLLEQFSIQDYEALCSRARNVAEHALRAEIIDRITTHETLFFRDKSCFDALQHKILPELFDAKTAAASRHLRIWSAACSTGQEPYSIAMIISELLRSTSTLWNIEIVATDVSDPAVRAASLGMYKNHELARCSIPTLIERYTEPEGDGRKVRHEIRSMCRFQTLDLQRDFSLLGSFDLILCRNVLIYFDQTLRTDILRRIAARLNPTGRFLVGATENLLDSQTIFRREDHCGASVYRLAGS